MKRKNVIYRDHGKVYKADSCDPLIQAWKSGKVQLEAWARLSYPGYAMDEKVLKGVNTIGYWDAYYPQEWGLDWHRNEGIEITFLETGSMHYEMEEDSYLLTSDDFTITRPWQLHKVGNPAIGAGKLHWLIIDVGVRHPHQDWKWPSWILLKQDDLEELSKMLRQNEQPVWKANGDIKRCFAKIGQLIKADPTARNESWVGIYVNELLMHLLQLFREGSYQLNASLTDSIRTVEIFIRDLAGSYQELWTLDMMAEHCGMGITRFVHYFRQLTNSTPVQYLSHLRAEAAANKLIIDPLATITEIGYECGFSSSQYFSTVFRKQFGCTPATYRKNSTATLGIKAVKGIS